ncbi:MAG: RNA polymerase subunit sigma-70 [Geodermatophilaceae bacterium]|nr:RNA polymerase subunit sigma-70 [Geodermatophilaceae bacterium]
MSQSTLAAAIAGDERAFRDVISPHIRELHVHCYRMLGSVTDAEDTLQEVLLAAWRGMDGFAGRSSVRTWLYRIATNRCLNAIRDGKRRKPAEPIPPFEPPQPSRRGEITWLQPYPDTWLDELEFEDGPAARYQQREAVELAFIAALQRLPPRQTASLLLCDVLGYTGAEAAAMMDTSATAIKGALQRARRSLDRLSATPGVHTAAHAGSYPDRVLARRFAEAFTRDDIDGVIDLLTDDAWLSMPPAPHEYQGASAIASFLRASVSWKGPRKVRLLETRANHQPAFGYYLSAPGSPSAQRAGLIVLSVVENRIIAMTRFLDERLPAIFGLPDRSD